MKAKCKEHGVDLFPTPVGAAHREGTLSQFVLVVVGGGTNPILCFMFRAMADRRTRHYKKHITQHL